MLTSGAGRTLANLQEHISAGRLNARVVTVIASRPGVGALDHAAAAGTPAHVIAHRAAADCATFSREVFSLVDDAGADLVCMAGWLCLTEIPWRYDARVMNIHPALLPAFGGVGMYGRRVHQAVIEHGCKVSGCTVHFVDNQYDNGPIILQRACEVRDDDTAETLAARVFALECQAYPEAIRLFAEGRLAIEGRRVRVRPERPSRRG